MSASEAKRKRTILGLLLAGTAALCLPAWLAPDLLFSGGATDSFRGRRYLMEELDEVDYAQLNIPEWLLRAEEGQDGQDMEAAMAAALSDYDSEEPSLTPNGIEDIVQATAQFANTIAIMVYDPPTDEFVLVYNKRIHDWVSGGVKLAGSFKKFSFMLRASFPERFKGAESPELAIAISSGDYPHLGQECINSFPHVSDSCLQKDAPILQFGSVFRHAEVFPNMIAMPMPLIHLLCFKRWTINPNLLCEHLRPGPENQGQLMYGEELGLTWENLIPQVVWRGSDFGYLGHIEKTSRFPAQIGPLVEKIDPTDQETDKKILGTRAMRESYDHLRPRWKGIVLTAEAEREAEEKSAALPWANIKFSGVSPTGSENAQFAEYGIPTVGERMPLHVLANYKYQIDLGGGGGTTWSGTVQKLAMPGLLFHHLTPTKDYIHDRMKPWIHYVPIAPDLRDLKEKYEWAESHPETAKMIADQGSALMRHLGTQEGFGAMYQEDFIDPLRRVIEAYQPVSTTRRGSSWREVLKTLEGDSYQQVWGCDGKTASAGSQCHRIDAAL
mmetsp:Transcript_993/g.2090  ORF Transcript_993/g.2090 Transcript_993/m.2090 type:complete len:555 (-) Transcript_993:134-1798(-)